MIKPGDKRIKKNTQQRAEYFKKNSDKNWKTDLSEDDICYIENQDKYTEEEKALVQYLEDAEQIKDD